LVIILLVGAVRPAEGGKLRRKGLFPGAVFGLFFVGNKKRFFGIFENKHFAGVYAGFKSFLRFLFPCSHIYTGTRIKHFVFVRVALGAGAFLDHVAGVNQSLKGAALSARFPFHRIFDLRPGLGALGSPEGLQYLLLQRLSIHD
jgi:hypothetical protein